MDNQIKEKNYAIVLLIVIIIILSVLCVLFATGIVSLKLKKGDTITNNKNEITTVDNNYNNIIGVYKASYDVDKIENLNCPNEIVVTLKLFEDGTFSYTQHRCVSSGIFGNYIINGDKLILNNWFNTENDVGFHTAIKGSKSLIIGDNGFLIDNNPEELLAKEIKQNVINLEKSQEKLEASYFKYYLEMLDRKFYDQTELAEPNM